MCACCCSYFACQLEQQLLTAEHSLPCSRIQGVLPCAKQWLPPEPPSAYEVFIYKDCLPRDRSASPTLPISKGLALPCWRPLAPLTAGACPSRGVLNLGLDHINDELTSLLVHDLNVAVLPRDSGIRSTRVIETYAIFCTLLIAADYSHVCKYCLNLGNAVSKRRIAQSFFSFINCA
jgi:hypothetical protein